MEGVTKKRGKLLSIAVLIKLTLLPRKKTGKIDANIKLDRKRKSS